MAVKIDNHITNYAISRESKASDPGARPSFRDVAQRLRSEETEESGRWPKQLEQKLWEMMIGPRSRGLVMPQRQTSKTPNLRVAAYPLGHPHSYCGNDRRVLKAMFA